MFFLKEELPHTVKKLIVQQQMVSPAFKFTLISELSGLYLCIYEIALFHNSLITL